MAEKNYAAIAAKHIIRPAEQKTYPRLLVYSRNKKGKTTFGTSGGPDKTLILDPEVGTKELRRANPHVWPISAWPDWDEAYQFLRWENKCPICPDHHPFQYVCVDGLTKAANQSLKYVMQVAEEQSMTRKVGMVQQRDYGKSGELMKDLLNNFHNLQMTVIFTAQERMVEAQDSEEDDELEEASAAYVPDLPKGARGAANSIVDVIGRLYVVRVEDPNNPEKTVGQRRLWLGESVKYDTGYRSEFILPDMVPNPTVPKLIRLMRTGKATAPKKTSAAAR